MAIFSKHIKQTNGVNKSLKINIDNFEKIKVIGKGGFAEKVYLARKKDDG